MVGSKNDTGMKELDNTMIFDQKGRGRDIAEEGSEIVLNGMQPSNTLRPLR